MDWTVDEVERKSKLREQRTRIRRKILHRVTRQWRIPSVDDSWEQVIKDQVRDAITEVLEEELR